MTVPARRPEDDAIDRLDHLSGILDAQLARDENGAPIGMQLRAIAATVREALERLRRHPDAWSQEAFDQQKARADAAEAENADLRYQLFAAQEWKERVRRLTEGLREIAEWDGRSAEIHGNRGVREYARALLSASPSDGDCEHDYVFVYGFQSKDDFYRCDKCGAKSDDGVYPKVGPVGFTWPTDEGAK